MKFLISLWNVVSMKVVCAWCGKHLEGDPDDKSVSHGICDDCMKNLK
jgi:hypothetical protein